MNIWTLILLIAGSPALYMEGEDECVKAAITLTQAHQPLGPATPSTRVAASAICLNSDGTVLIFVNGKQVGP